MRGERIGKLKLAHRTTIMLSLERGKSASWRRPFEGGFFIPARLRRTGLVLNRPPAEAPAQRVLRIIPATVGRVRQVGRVGMEAAASRDPTGWCVGPAKAGAVIFWGVTRFFTNFAGIYIVFTALKI